MHQRQRARTRAVHEVHLAGRILGDGLERFERLQLNIRWIARDRIVDLRDLVGLCLGQDSLAGRLLLRRLTAGLGPRNLLLKLGPLSGKRRQTKAWISTSRLAMPRMATTSTIRKSSTGTLPRLARLKVRMMRNGNNR